MSDDQSRNLSFASKTYLHFRRVWLGTYEQRKARRAESSGISKPFGKGRDPKLLGETLSSIASDLGWSEYLAESSVAQQWPIIVGESMAEHARVLEITEGVLRVQCDSTAWATELRRMRTQVLTRIHQDYPEANITEIKFIAPNAPSWKHGPKSIPGRGPRDTYG